MTSHTRTNNYYKVPYNSQEKLTLLAIAIGCLGAGILVLLMIAANNPLIFG